MGGWVVGGWVVGGGWWAVGDGWWVVAVGGWVCSQVVIFLGSTVTAVVVAGWWVVGLFPGGDSRWEYRRKGQQQ